MAGRLVLVAMFIQLLFVLSSASILDNIVGDVLMTKGVKDNAKGKHWALIVAGSNGWDNYRHQADACHAYHVMKNHGIPDERIVVMMYDDIANNDENPTPGIVINHPNGSDVYAGVPKDYTGAEVTPEIFLKVLQGDSPGLKGIGSGKVINSGHKDHVFVNFVDHGAPGIVAFPDGELTARKLNNAIKKMHKAKKFQEMVLYIEACESGSMFAEGLLPANINVFATTAANSEESSYACYFDKERETYLGDVYSVKWMEDSDKENLNTETLQKQFQIVKKETNTSHVMEFGDMTISDESVGQFQGGKQAEPIILPTVPLDAVRSEDVPLAILYHKLEKAQTEEERAKVNDKLQKTIKIRDDIANTMKSIVSMVTGDSTHTENLLSMHHKLVDFDCYEAAMRHFDEYCFDLSTYDYALRQLYALVNLCEENLSTNNILKAIYTVCQK